MLKPLLQFQNPDSTRDINDTNLVFNKGVFSGGQVLAGTIADGLVVSLQAFAAVGNDGMFVQETDITTLSVVDGVRNFIVLRSIYKDNAEPVVQVESLDEAAYLGDSEIEFLVVFAVVDVPLSDTFVTQSMISYQESNIVDTLGRLSLRGTITNAGNLPAGSLNSNRPGDFYIVTSGESDVPEMYVWNGTGWQNITQAQVLSTLLQEHIDNLSNNAKHLTNTQFEAVLGTTGTPNNSNRFVTELDARLPAQNENDGMTGDPTILSGSSNVDQGAGYRGSEPNLNNQFTLNSKIFAVPAEKSFSGGAVIELLESDGPIYVGKGAVGTAQQWFNIYKDDTTGADRDKELINSQGRPVRVTGVFTEASLTNELNPQNPQVDDLGFWRDLSVQGNPGGPLYLEVSDKDADGQADVDFLVGYGKRTTMQELLPQAFIERGPQFGQVDARMNQVLVTDTTPNFRDSEWDGGTSPGDVIAYDSTGGGAMVQHDISGNLFPVGIRGNFNNLIQDGIYEFPVAPGGFTAGDEVYASNSTPGAMTVTPNDRFVGTFLTTTKLLVSMNSIGISSTVVPPGTAFPGGLINASPGQVVAWNASSSMWEPWEKSFAFAPQGILGNSNNIIHNEQWVPGGSPFLNGTRYYAWFSGAPGGVLTPGDLTTTQNDFFVGRASTTDNLMIECVNAPLWETARAIVTVEHDDATGFHDEGSGRSWIGLEAARFAASGGLATSTGMFFYATDTGRVFYCTSGTGNTWVEQTSFTGPVTIDNNLIVSSQIRMPAKVLHDNVSDSMNPFEHASRHFLGAGDYLKGRIEQILSDGSDTPFGLSGPGLYPVPDQTIASIAFDFSGRNVDSTILMLGQVWYHEDAGSGRVDITTSLFLDGVEVAVPFGIRSKVELANTSGNDDGTVTIFGFSTTVSDGAHTLDLRTGVNGSTPVAEQRSLMLLDLGLS